MRITKWMLSSIIAFMSLVAHAADLEVRKINPPNLNPDHLGKYILCHRPMREGAPAMYVESKDGKIIAHNYGHGGSGWTLGPGAAKYVVEKLEKYSPKGELTKKTPVAIIGAGALGLFSALELVNHGYKNITIYAEAFDDLTSHNAGGLLAPVSMDDAPEIQSTIDYIGIEAYKFYKSVALKQNKQITKGARIMPAYFSNREDADLEPYVGKVMSPAKDVIVDFKNGATHQMVVYDDGIFMDTGSLMKSLTAVLKSAKIKFIKKKINNFASLKEKVIFNCTGNGAKALNQDDKLVSVQGHLVMLINQQPKDLEYMILVYFEHAKTKNNQDVKRSFYMFPKRLPHEDADDVGVIGGTFINGADSSTPNNEEFDIMLNNARKFYGLTK